MNLLDQATKLNHNLHIWNSKTLTRAKIKRCDDDVDDDDDDLDNLYSAGEWKRQR